MHNMQSEYWKTWTAQELDKQYQCSAWSKRFATSDDALKDHVEFISSRSKAAKASIPCEEGVITGLVESEKIDIFAPSDGMLPRDAPIFVFLHGGYWQEGSRLMSSHMAPCFVNAGAAVVIPGYTLAPEASIDQIVSEVKRCVSYVLHLAKRRGSRGVYLCGHSAGAQLAAMMLATDWTREFMQSPSLIKGAFLLSGIYDLRPICGTSLNKALKMTEEDALRNSPCQYTERMTVKQCSIMIAYGEDDPPEIARQAREYHQALSSSGVSSKLLHVPGVDHFNLMENLAFPDYILTKEMFHVMGCIQETFQNMQIS